MIRKRINMWGSDSEEPLWKKTTTGLGIYSTDFLGVGDFTLGDPSSTIHLKGDNTSNTVVIAQSHSSMTPGFQLSKGATSHISLRQSLEGEMHMVFNGDSKFAFDLDGNMCIGKPAITNADVKLDIASGGHGVLKLPLLTTTQYDSIALKENGFLFYNTTTNKLQAYIAGTLRDITTT